MSGYIHTFYATEHSESSPAVTSLLLSQPGAVQGYNWLICVSGVWIKTLRVLLCSGTPRTSVEAMFLSMYIFFFFLVAYCPDTWGGPIVSLLSFSVILVCRRYRY